MLYSATKTYYTRADYCNDYVSVNYDCSSVWYPSFRSRYKTVCDWHILCNSNQISCYVTANRHKDTFHYAVIQHVTVLKKVKRIKTEEQEKWKQEYIKPRWDNEDLFSLSPFAKFGFSKFSRFSSAKAGCFCCFPVFTVLFFRAEILPSWRTCDLVALPLVIIALLHSACAASINKL